MLKYSAVYGSFLLSLLVIDLIWLLGIAKNMYRDEMGSLMASEPKLLAGLAFYLLYALGATIFVILPALSKQSWLYAAQYGALFGFFIKLNPSTILSVDLQAEMAVSIYLFIFILKNLPELGKGLTVPTSPVSLSLSNKTSYNQISFFSG